MVSPETTEFPGSSNLQSAEYDPESEDLTITFRDQSQYLYRNVPPHVYRKLQTAPSAGEYFNRQIKKGPYPHERV